MYPGLDEDEPELGVLVLPVPLQVLPDVDSLLDEVVDVLGEVGRQALPLENAQDLVAGDEPDLCYPMAVPEDDADLRGGQALLGELVDLLLDVVRGHLEPVGHRPPEGEGRLRDALPGRVHPTHDYGNMGGDFWIKVKAGNKSYKTESKVTPEKEEIPVE